MSAATHPAQPCMSSLFQEVTLPVEKDEPGLEWCRTSTCSTGNSVSNARAGSAEGSPQGVTASTAASNCKSPSTR